MSWIGAETSQENLPIRRGTLSVLNFFTKDVDVYFYVAVSDPIDGEFAVFSNSLKFNRGSLQRSIDFKVSRIFRRMPPSSLARLGYVR